MEWLEKALDAARELAQEFYRTTGSPLHVDLKIPGHLWVYVLSALSEHMHLHLHGLLPLPDHVQVHDHLTLRRAP